jgi:hypothetical protein
MKKLFSTAGLLFLAITIFAQTAPTATEAAKAPIIFKEVKHDFGKIKQGTPVTFDFEFKNTSSQPVVIESATASCGCTTPVKPEAPVAKGKNSKITAGFNAAAAGPFDKTIFVKVAGTEKPLEIKIVGEVLNADDYAKYEKTKNDKAKKSSR